MNSRILPVSSAALALALAASPAHATLIGIYTPPGEGLALEEMAALARALRDNPGAAPETRFTYRVSEEPALTAAFSVPADASGYFWADETVLMDPDYQMGSSAYYVTELATAGPAAIQGSPEAVQSFSTVLRSATVRDGRIGISYSLDRSLPVTVEAFSPAGRRLNRWHWKENGAGLFERSFRVPRGASGVLLLRWTAGETRVTHKVPVPGSDH